VSDFADRTGNVPPRLITTDDCTTYGNVLLEQYGETTVSPRTGKRGRPQTLSKQWPDGAVYATVNKSYKKGKVEFVDRKLVHGSADDLRKALDASSCSDKINTSFVERQNGTDRSYNSRKARKTYEFSKDFVLHLCVSWWVIFCYNFHHVNRGLSQRLSDGTRQHRTPAMAIGLAESPLSVREIYETQIVGFTPSVEKNLAQFSNMRPLNCAPT